MSAHFENHAGNRPERIDHKWRPLILVALLLAFLWAVSSNANDYDLHGWKIHEKADEWDDSASRWATSPTTASPNRLEFPYRGIKSWIQLRCDDEDREASVALGFTQSPNLTGGDYMKMYGGFVYTVDLRWAGAQKGDRHLNSVTLKDSSSRWRFFTSSRFMESDMQDRDWLKVRMDWYGSGAVVFHYDTRGFAAAHRALDCQAIKPKRRIARIRERRISEGDLFAGCEVLGLCDRTNDEPRQAPEVTIR